jgi:predicted lysophospholipase L1 biosynthesis ABC-type transport system permease subunit
MWTGVNVHSIGHALGTMSRDPAVNHPRAQQYQRLTRCALFGAASVVVAIAALAALASRAVAVGVVMLAAAAMCASASRSALKLARRNRVGADSEDAVRRALGTLVREGWSVQHGVD